MALLAVSEKLFRSLSNFFGISGDLFNVYSFLTQERVKAWQSWQGVQRDLNKRREAKVKTKLNPLQKHQDKSRHF